MAKSKRKSPSLSLKGHIAKQDHVTIRLESGASLCGFVLDESKDFILLGNVEEFQLNGYAIFLKKNVTKILSAKLDKVIKKILKAEEYLDDDFGIAGMIDLGNWQKIFTDLQKLDYHILIGYDDVTYVGAIKKILKDAVAISDYGLTGSVSKKIQKLDYDNIKLIKFDDRYSTTLRRYLVKRK